MTISKILVVDDSATDLVHIQSIVKAQGFVVTTASSGKEAVEKARTEKPDMIFLDVIMNEMDGFKTCRTLGSMAETKHIPVVFLTSKHQKADKTWAEMQGGKGFLTKPASAEMVANEIKRFS
jgi:twitching motility two-component system response regulator PilH